MVVEESTILKREPKATKEREKGEKKKRKKEKKRKERILLIQTRFRASYIMA